MPDEAVSNFLGITQRINEFSTRKDFRLKITVHARKRMKERSISELDIRSILRSGHVIKHEADDKGERYKMRGETDDERKIAIIISFLNDAIRVTVVTVWKD